MKRNSRVAILLFISAFCLGNSGGSLHAQGNGQKTFSSSREALVAFVAAVRDGDPVELAAILGPGSEQVVSSSDSVADKTDRESFLEWYDERHSFLSAHHGEFTLQVGKKNWPLPIPLAHKGNQWYWDGQAGTAEILYRRVGHNELAAIKVCKGIVSAQRDYAAATHDGNVVGAYAVRLVSQPGKQNGLYWEAKDGEPESPAGPMLAQAASEGYDTSGKKTPYHGYYYRMLSANTGFGFLAYPADYRSSGVMTFLVSQSGVIYQKDLGDKTADLAQQISGYAPDQTWSVVR